MAETENRKRKIRNRLIDLDKSMLDALDLPPEVADGVQGIKARYYPARDGKYGFILSVKYKGALSDIRTDPGERNSDYVAEPTIAEKLFDTEEARSEYLKNIKKNGLGVVADPKTIHDGIKEQLLDIPHEHWKDAWLRKPLADAEAKLMEPLREQYATVDENGNKTQPSAKELLWLAPETYAKKLQEIRQELVQEQQVEAAKGPDVAEQPEPAKSEEVGPGLPAIRSREVTIPEPEIVDSGIGQGVVTAKAQVNYGPEDAKKGGAALDVDFEPVVDATQQPGQRGPQSAPAREPEQQVEPTDPAPTEPAKEPEQAPATEPEPTQPGQTKPTPAKDPGQQAQDMLNNWPSGVAVPGPEQRRRFEPKIPPEVLHCKNDNPRKPYVLDHGDRIAVTHRAMLGIGREAQNKREQSVMIALKAAVDRFGEPVQFHGTRAFERETIDVAVRYGIALEPVSEHAKGYYKEALEKQQKQQLTVTNSLGPARKKDQSKDQGISL